MFRINRLIRWLARQIFCIVTLLTDLANEMALQFCSGLP